jgi:hypothetical protein
VLRQILAVLQFRGCRAMPKHISELADLPKRFRYARAAGLLLACILLLTGCSSEWLDVHAAPRHETKANAKKTSVPYRLKAQSKFTMRQIPAAMPTEPIRGIYVSAPITHTRRMNSLIGLVDRTELNAMVIDVNSGFNLLTRPVSADPATFKQAQTRNARHLRETVRLLRRHRIYPIARIVTFKDPLLAAAIPSWTIKRRNGTVWRDRGGAAWIDPFREEAWAYPLALIKEAAAAGFEEVQFDYVRFPENGAKLNREVAFHNSKGWTKSEAIGRFLREARNRAHASGIRISADVFGMVGSIGDDMGIGQKWQTISPEIDFISPMLYPSHYNEGTWGIAHPDLMPGRIIQQALGDANGKNRKLRQSGRRASQIRPWLQGFTASWVHPHQKYGAAQIREQIRAANRAGFPSYLIWNSSCRYPEYKV